jgi:hypothetical protein
VDPKNSQSETNPGFVNPALDEPTGGGDDSTVVDSEPTEPPTRPAPLSYTRGMSTRAVTAWLRNTRGEESVARVAAALPAWVVEDLHGESLRPPLMSWVPFLSHCELLAQVEALYGRGDGSVLVEVGRAAAYRDIPSIAKPFARFLNPGFLVDMVTKIWRVYHTEGAWEVSRSQRDLQAILISRPESHPAFCPVLIGYIEGAMTLAGALDVKIVEERCANKGATCCSLRMKWSEKSDAARDRLRDRVPRAPT